MLESPNYTLYSLSELKDALANIDRELYPERAQSILREIEAQQVQKNQTSQPSKPKFHEDLHANWFVRYWRGQVSLPMSYWGVGITINLLILGLSKVIQLGIESSNHNWQLGAYILGLYSFIIAAMCWQSVGLFRTARKHPLRTGDSGWATVAIIMLFIGLISFSNQMYTTGYPIMKSGFQLIIGSSESNDTQFRVLNNGTDIELIGGISLESEQMLEEALINNPDIRRIHLHSRGGRVLAAKRMVKIIKQYELDTYVKSECMSACTLLFLAGKNKLLANEGKLKFHAPGIGGISSHNNESLGQNMRRAYEAEQVPIWFLNKIMSTPNNTFWTPTQAELLKANIVDEVVDPDLYPISGLGPESEITVDELESGLLTVDYMAAMKKFDSEAYTTIIDIYLKGMLAGIPQKEIMSQFNHFLYNERLPVYLAGASDEALVQYWEAQIFHMKELKESFPLACASLSYPEEVPEEHRYGSEGTMSSEAQSLELAALAKLIASHRGNYVIIGEVEKQSLIQKVIGRVREKNEVFYDVIRSAKDFVDQPFIFCEAGIALNESFISFDLQTSGQLLRSL